MTTYKLGIMGFGSAAKALVKILIDKEGQLRADGIDFQITAVTTGSKGNLTRPEGLDKAALLSHLEAQGHFKGCSEALSPLTTQEIIETADYDILLELTPLNIFTGQPAIDHIKGAMNRGKHVITANKGPIAWAYGELKRLAAEQQVQFFYETTVMDGTPIFNLVKETLPYCQVTEIKGILNSTTNFVLGCLEEGQSYEAAMEEGRRRGFVEADPSLDIDGWDAAAKLTALMNVLMDANLTPDQIDRQGISGISADQLLEAKARGKSIKLLCHGQRTAAGLLASVKPAELPLTDIYASIDATSSVVSIRTDLMGEISIIEHNPEIEQTGFGIFSDLISLVSQANRHTLDTSQRS